MSAEVMNNAPSVAMKPDFPTWIPAMLVKELRQGLRTRGFVATMVGLHAVMVVVFLWAFAIDAFEPGAAHGMVNGFFWSLVGLVLMFVTPLRGLGGLQSEIQSRNLDLLMLTRLTPWRIVLGKWGSLMTQAALIVLTLLPYGVVRYFLGSVDLLEDLWMIAWMYTLCCVTTALTLWFSGLSLFLRIVLVLAVVIGSQMTLGSTLIRAFMYGGRGMGGFGFGATEIPWVAQFLVLFNVAILLVFCLLQAVRRISPPAENHSCMTRLLGLVALIPIPFLALAQGTRAGEYAVNAQTVVALVGFMLVCVLELGSLATPMAVQVRSWWRKENGTGKPSFWRSFTGRFLMPGWPSAALFTAGGLVIFAALTLLGALPDEASRWRFTRVLVLAWVAVVFPATLMSFFPAKGTPSLLIYIILQGIASALCIFGGMVSAGASGVPALQEAVQSLCRVLPVSSFWFELVRIDKRSSWDTEPGFIFVQAAMILLVFLFTLWRSRPYWREISHHLTALPRKNETEEGTPHQ